MLLGFSDGVLNKKFNDKLDRYQNYYLDKYFFNSIEIHCVDEKNMNFIINDLDKSLYSKFKYISLHAPIFYNDDYKNLILLNKLRLIYNKLKIKNIVIHPSKQINWNIFDEFIDLPLSLENMDSNKRNFKEAEEFENIINNKKLNITLDLNHIGDNDASMNLSKKFHNKFRDKIVEYHISGFTKKNKHLPLFKTKQLKIIKSLELKKLPIIIESDCNNFSSLKKEYYYIKNNLL